MFRKLTVEEQLRIERQKALEESNKQKEAEKLILEQVVDIDFRQSMMEMGVM